MVSFDVTPGWVSAVNSGAEAAVGYDQAQSRQRGEQLARETFELAKKTAAEKNALEQQKIAQQQQLLDVGAADRAGQGKALEAYAGITGSQFKMPGEDDSNRSGNESFFGRSDASAPASEEEEAAQLHKYLDEQRKNILAFAGNYPPDVRRAFLQHAIPLLGQDEQQERETVAQRWQLTHWKEALQSGLLDPEEQALAQEAIDGLSQGATSSTNSKQSLHILRNAVGTRTKRQMDTQFGMQWAQQQISEASQGGVDPSKLHKVFADWLTSDKRDPKELQRKMLDARYDLKPRTIKMGAAEVPHTLDVMSPQWSMIAESEADKEASQALAHDPVWAKKIKDGAVDEKEYAEAKADTRKQIMRSYAARFGADPSQIDQLGLTDDRAKRAAMKQAEQDIRAALKKAGIDPDKEVISDQQKKLEQGLRDRQGAFASPPNADPSDWDRSKLSPDGNDKNNDGVIDEKDLDSEPDSDSDG